MKPGLTPHAYADFLTGKHLDSDSYQLALYDKEPEVGTHYEGDADYSVELTGYRLIEGENRAAITFSDVHLDGVTLRYRYAVLFNADKENRTISCIDTGKHVGVELGNLSIYMPKDGLVELGEGA